MSRMYRHQQILKMLERFVFATFMVAILSTSVRADSAATLHSSGDSDCQEINTDENFGQAKSLAICAPEFSYWTVGLHYLDGDAALPVALISFSASKHGETVDLQWSTSFEEENTYFVVERSVDGQAWEPLASVIGRGSDFTLFDYTFQDRHPATGSNHYRLAQVMADGTTTYSETVSATFAPPIAAVLLSPPTNTLR